MHLLPPSLPSCQEVKRRAVKLERVSREHSGKELREGKCQHVKFSVSLHKRHTFDGPGHRWRSPGTNLAASVQPDHAEDDGWIHNTSSPQERRLQPAGHTEGAAISKPAAMQSNCNSVSCANPSAQSCRCSGNRFQFWTTVSVTGLCMFLCTGVSKGALRV